MPHGLPFDLPATRFVIETWPDLDIMPAETIRRYFSATSGATSALEL